MAAARATLEDEGVDVGLIGCVPLTAALQTLPAEKDRADDIEHPGSVAQRPVRPGRESSKAWLVMVDAGGPFDPRVPLAVVVLKTALGEEYAS